MNDILPKTIAYLRVSTIDQDIEKNKADILRLANDKDLGQVNFIEEKVSGKISWRKRKMLHIGPAHLYGYTVTAGLGIHARTVI